MGLARYWNVDSFKLTAAGGVVVVTVIREGIQGTVIFELSCHNFFLIQPSYNQMGLNYPHTNSFADIL